MKEFKVGEYIARGTEKKVYEDADDPEKVIGLYHMPAMSKERVKAQFYLTKILHMLFPKNIPDIYLSASDPHVVRKEKISTDVTHKIIQKWYEPGADRRNISEDEHRKLDDVTGAIYSDPKYMEFITDLDKLGVHIDSYVTNFTRDSEGNMIYLDDIDPSTAFGLRGFDRERFMKAIDKIPGEDKKKALHYLDRLEMLEEKIFQKSSANI
ncbi:MAG: hypothetical protein Q8R40_05845 [bacterium]|nr:hypothetical protein [bacterium]